MRRIFFLIVAFLVVVISPQRVRAVEPDPLDFPPTKYCTEPDIPVSLRAEELEGKQAWSRCEAWVWSCIVQGKEANLFAKKCTTPRRESDGIEPNYRKDYQFAPFVAPDDYAEKNALSDTFLRTILSNPEYSTRIPPAGIRIFGGYFAKAVNLENVTTEKNLVLDGSIFKRGIRMTNYETTKNVSLDGANVRGLFLLMRAHIKGSLFIEKGVYDVVDARDARIGASLEGSRSVFAGMFRFDRAHISGKVLLVKSRITSLHAWDVTIGGSMELRHADIRLRMDLTGSTVRGDVRLQEVSFGRKAEGRTPSCEWNPDTEVDHILHEVYRPAKLKDQAIAERVLNEMMRTRPFIDGKLETLCDEKVEDGERPARHELLLRDMKINGTLCVMDTSGLIEPDPTHAHSKISHALETITFDGTDANSTVWSWAETISHSPWHAVNFKTGHMLINLHASPESHFIDNLDVGFFSFVKRDFYDKSKKVDDDDDKYLCDVTPRRDNMDRPEEREVQTKIIKFFSGTANRSESAQPFTNVVTRLEETGMNTKVLRIALSEYRFRNLCSSSVFVKSHQEFQKVWNRLGDQQWQESLKDARSTWAKATGGNQTTLTDETRKLGLDGLCAAGLPIYKYSVNYGHEPLNLFYYFFGFIAWFWMLLRWDKAPPSDGTFPAQKLGFIYALDTFIPLAKFRIDQEKANCLPHRPWLRKYLNFHRIAGAVISLAIFIFVINAARN